jgi:biopolymer transport protein ExbD
MSWSHWGVNPRGFRVSIAQPDEPVNCSAKRTTCIHVVSPDKVVINHEPLATTALGDRLQTMFPYERVQITEEPNIYVMADRDLEYQDVAHVIDIAYNNVNEARLILVSWTEQRRLH